MNENPKSDKPFPGQKTKTQKLPLLYTAQHTHTHTHTHSVTEIIYHYLNALRVVNFSQTEEQRKAGSRALLK